MYKHSDYSITQISLTFVIVYSYRPPSWYNDSKCVVYLSKLMQPLSICPSCTGKSDVKFQRRLGAYLMYKTICTLRKKERTWSNSEEHIGKYGCDQVKQQSKDHNLQRRSMPLSPKKYACYLVNRQHVSHYTN